MKITWATLVFWIKYPKRKPYGLTLKYEFRPSCSYYVGEYDVHPEYYKLSKEEYQEAKEKRLHALHTNQQKALMLNPANFLWQLFTLINNKGEKLILQMDRGGQVTQLKEVQKIDTYTVLVKA